jgi:hypothetical protein
MTQTLILDGQEAIGTGWYGFIPTGIEICENNGKYIITEIGANHMTRLEAIIQGSGGQGEV